MAGLLSAWDLAELRSAAESGLADTCTIQTLSQVSDGAGGFVDTWLDAATVACNLAPSGLTPREQMIAERVQPQSTWNISVPALTVVDSGNRIVIGTRTFNVVDAAARIDEITRKCVCTEVQP